MVKNATIFGLDALEYEHKDRGNDWFWAVGIISVSFAIVAIIFHNIIFGILILVSAFALCLFVNRPPHSVHIIISEDGVSHDKIHNPFDTLESFWVDESSSHKKILFNQI